MTDLRQWSQRGRTFKVKVRDESGESGELDGRVLLGQEAMDVGRPIMDAGNDRYAARAATVKAAQKVFAAFNGWPDEDVEHFIVRTGGFEVGKRGSGVVDGVVKALGWDALLPKAAEEVAAANDDPT